MTNKLTAEELEDYKQVASVVMTPISWLPLFDHIATLEQELAQLQSRLGDKDKALKLTYEGQIRYAQRALYTDFDEDGNDFERCVFCDYTSQPGGPDHYEGIAILKDGCPMPLIHQALAALRKELGEDATS